MNIQLSDHFTVRKLLRFVLPSIGMMIFISVYGVVDGFFVSNYAGKQAFAALNLIIPFPMMLSAFGFMIGAGGSALVGQRLGQQRDEEARQIFTMLVEFMILVSVILTVFAELFMPKAAVLLGAEDDMIADCVLYGRIYSLGLPFFMVQNYFQSLFVTAGKPHLGLLCTVIAGCTNILGDFLLVGVFKGGLAGAAWATFISCTVGALIPLIYFSRKNSSSLRFVRAKFDGRALVKTMTNGSSELMSNLCANIVNMLYNLQLMKYAGADGVAAFGVIMYVNFIFAAVYFGFSIGSAPIISYHYGAGDREELHSLYQKSLGIITVFAAVLTASAMVSAPLLAGIFVGYDQALLDMTIHGFRIYAVSFLLFGYNIFASSFFTALGNGGLSALISFLRTLVFEVFAILLLPYLFRLEGVWWAVTLAEGMALAVSFACLIRSRSVYGY